MTKPEEAVNSALLTGLWVFENKKPTAPKTTEPTAKNNRYERGNIICAMTTVTAHCYKIELHEKGLVLFSSIKRYIYHYIICRKLSFIFRVNIMKCIEILMVIRIPILLQALCGTILDVPTLTGEKIPINLSNEIVKPTTVKRIQGHGLPFPKEPSRKGDLLVSFDIKFPEALSSSVKDILYDTLPN